MSFTHKSTGRIAESTPSSEAERRVRTDLAAAYRLVAINGWDDLIYTHISASVPEEPGHFLINPFGFAFDDHGDLLMPTFRIELFEGRSVEQTRQFIEAITKATCESLNVEPNSVDIILVDVKRENWATGGRLWSDPAASA